MCGRDGVELRFYFCPDDPHVIALAEHLLQAQEADGGFTWDIHSESGDPHTTLCVLEGFGQLGVSVPEHAPVGIEEAKAKAFEFLLSNRLFIDAADRRFRKLSYPYRYRYDLLRALECFANQHVSHDVRMQPAIDWLHAKRKKDGLWYLENRHKGNEHLLMEELGKPSRFITLKALYIGKYLELPAVR